MENWWKMKNHKQLLMDFYLNLLALPKDSLFIRQNQYLYANVREVLAAELGSDPETVQDIFERMASEDR